MENANDEQRGLKGEDRNPDDISSSAKYGVSLL